MYIFIYVFKYIYIGGVTEDVMSMVVSIVTDIMKMEEERDEILESAGRALVDDKVTTVFICM
jgi:hypothetical protein